MNYDIIIVGGGIVGSTLACALAQQTSLNIAILEKQSTVITWTDTHYHHRVSAISLASQRIFTNLDIWSSILNKRASIFSRIQAWDAHSKNSIEFDSAEINESGLGFIIENNAIQLSLDDKLKTYSQVTRISPITLTAFIERKEGVELTCADGSKLTARLVVAADGAKSWLREMAHIALDEHDYEQKAIVTTVTTRRTHQQIARQWFLPTGPLAFLPLLDKNTCSIVWTLPSTLAEQYKIIESDDFCSELSNVCADQLGEVLSLTERHTYPLYKQQAKQYSASRLVLVGDAAHVIHPLAGQGVNMGLLDAASLVDVIVNAISQHRDFSGRISLRQYERWRKADNVLMLTGIDYIKALFASDKWLTRTLRTGGLYLTNHLSIIKSIFMRHAIGNRGDLPKLARCAPRC